MVGRRELFAAALGGAFIPSALRASDWGMFTEQQQGDPNIEVETIKLDAANIQQLIKTLATYRPRIPNAQFMASLDSAAKPMIGWSRATTPEKIADILGVFGLNFKEGGTFVPFCAAGVSYLVACAYLDFWKTPATTTTVRNAMEEIDRYHFYPSPSVLDMYYVARGKHRWVDAKPKSVVPKPGWLVIYDWSGRGSGANHVGLVTGADGGTLQTIEFNTSKQNQRDGGQVARRTRIYNNTVRGFVRTDIATLI